MNKFDYDKLKLLNEYVRQLDILQNTDHSLELDSALDTVQQMYVGLMKKILEKYDLGIENIYEDNVFTEPDNVRQDLFGWTELKITIPDPPQGVEHWLGSQELYFFEVSSGLGY